MQWIFIFSDGTTFLEITPNLNNSVLKLTPVTVSFILSCDLQGLEIKTTHDHVYSYIRVAMPGQTKGLSSWISWL